MKILTPETMPKTDAEAKAYLPDEYPVMKQAAAGLYQVRRARGDTIERALEHVYCAVLGLPVSQQGN